MVFLMQFERLNRRCWKIDDNPLWAKLNGFICSTAVLNRTISTRQCKQVIQDVSGHITVLPLKDYRMYYMRCCQLLYTDAEPSIVYASFCIQGMSTALCQKVETKCQDHIGHQVMTNEVQFDMMKRTY